MTEFTLISKPQNVSMKINNLIAIRVNGELVRSAGKVKYLGVAIDQIFELE